MHRRKVQFVFAMATLLLSIPRAHPIERFALIPIPAEVESKDGYFNIIPSTTIGIDDEAVQSDALLFIEYIYKKYGLELKLKKNSGLKTNQVNISLKSQLGPEAYSLSVDTDNIRIIGGDGAGVFYALQTLIQLLPAGKTNSLNVPSVKINDKPRFNYRGMHLDVARHFFPVLEVKKYIDHIAMYKMNVFHWHLTDDQGWRIEIKRYPKLQSIGAWRSGTLIGHKFDQPARYDSIRYGGYYTQEEIKEVVEYAARRHITIIPEIEMPGHAQAAIAAYPTLACTNGPFEVGRTWGIYKDVFCPKPQTFEFLENVLNEVCDLFPGKYIHIGGDECPKDRWKECSHCQELIRRENLKDENGLQGYFTNRIVKYLALKNKIAIGWDDILEEGLDKNAVVMSWRGYNGGVNAAVKGHDVIMAPASQVYFDMYQSRFTGGRIAIGGFLPLEQVYRFDPIPDVLNSDQALHILGAQGNLWTEYIDSQERLEEMIFPRMSALAEVLWSPNEKRNYESYTSRLLLHFKLLGFLKLHYSTALFDISTQVFPNGDKGIYIELISGYPRGKIYYTLNGTTPTLASEAYDKRIPVDQSVGIHAALFEGVQQRGEVFTRRYEINHSTGKEVILANPPHPEYSRGGAFSLVNGLTGGLPWIPSEWLGFRGTDLDATIDLGSLITIMRVNVDVLKDEEGKIFLPSEVSVLISTDGKDYREAATLNAEEIRKMNRKLKLQFTQTQARYVRVIAKNANGKDWLFVDEIGVE